MSAPVMPSTGQPVAAEAAAGQIRPAATTAAADEPWNRPFYADPNSPANQVVRAEPDNQVAATIAGVPQARWFTPDNPVPTIRAAVADYVDGATAAGGLPVLVTYAIPGRDCGSYSGGGLPDAATYKSWTQELRAGIGANPAVVIVEPDALTSADCLADAARTERYGMLADAVAQLGAGGATLVYLDGGHSRWLSVTELVDRLNLAGVRHARGFSLNVSNFYTTSEQEAYGEEVSARLPGKSYVVDVSRNGRGPAPDEPLNWCNPVDRGLGALPTAQTSAAHDDANLWIKNPGQSDGTCERGDPYSGHWFQDRAANMLDFRAAW
ncbi:glycoside hydrolase family 6 protein [Saccharothrix xinjiangensis]|uniref:Glucanase n=1 Tax=Saccharothrix xinjiangensis TaxID=204798 RepID=A0ABV9XTJ5_9PSEU